MKLTPTTIAVPVLLVLLTWLSLRAANADAEFFDRALGALDRFAMLESALQRDVLAARTGILHNYDPLVRETAALDAAVGSLRQTAAVNRKSVAALDRVTDSIASQEDLVERFKSSNALLQNSLASFELLSGRLDTADGAGSVAPAVSALAAAMLHLTLDTSPMSCRKVEDRLAELAARPVPPGEEDLVGALLAHGRVLHDLLPATDEILTTLAAMQMKRDLEIIRGEVLSRQAKSRTTARQFRLLLYATSVCLVGLLVYLGLQVHQRNRTLQRRAAFEHALAGLSTRFISAPPHDTGLYVEEALAVLAERLGADRAYFLSSGAQALHHAWSSPGNGPSPGWPDGAIALARRVRPVAERIIHVPSVDRLPEGEDRETLAAAGVSSWVCVQSPDATADGALLGFDTLQPSPPLASDELGLLRMAHDAIANAVGRQSLERERVRLEQHLLQARRMETLGALTSGIAHNFNNIVGAILGYTEMAEAQVAAGSRTARNLGEIRRAGERARDLVDQILTFGRRRDIRRRPIDVRDLVAECASLLRASLPPGIDLVIGEVPEQAVIIGERAQLQQVILNLCNNAAQAMDGLGRIDVRVEIQEHARPRALSHGNLAPGRQIAIAVRDCGRGMDARMLGRIFEPFFTTRTAGTGLGLATVQEIVREHGGTLHVESTLGAGSLFEAWFPCATAMTPVADWTPPALPLGRGETVMLIHGDRERLLKDEEILAALGYEPVGFITGESALAACRHSPNRFDMLVLGHVTPTAAALQLADALRKIVPDLPILLATTSANEIGPDHLLASGIWDIVSWPFVASEIATALERCSPRATRARTPLPKAQGF